ncbi:MAG: glycosyltransferase family 4 protein [Chloroflexota bacterium]|jgi:glycosyltransferase involved in cell wall biosynthesis
MLPLRILIVQETDWLERNVIHQHHLAERLVKMGHEVRVIDYGILWRQQDDPAVWQPRQIFPDVSRVLDDIELTVIRPSTINLPLLTHLSWALASLRELQSLHDEWPFEVVLGLTLTNSYLLARSLARMNIPFIYVILEPYHTMMDEWWLRPIARLAESCALRVASRILVFTPQMAQYARGMGAGNDQITTLKTGVSLDLFRPDLNSQPQRAKLGIEQEVWVLLFMGWLYRFSGLLEIIQALAKNPARLGGSALLIVGDGDLFETLTELVDRHNLGQQVILTGRRPYEEIPYLLAAADVCLLPSQVNDTTRDIVPMKVYEYLAVGRPVVATRLPGLITEFGDSSGILYADDPVSALDEAVGLSNRSEERLRLATAARNTAVQNADWDKIAEQLAGILSADISEAEKSQ